MIGLPLTAVLALGALAACGCYSIFLRLQFMTVRRKVVAAEKKAVYDPVHGFRTGGGEPLFLTADGNTSTLFFLEGFRTQSPAGMYRDYFETLFRDGKTNVIVPVYGLQSSTFDYRNRDWRFEEDMRLVSQVYAAYSKSVAPGHRIVTCSQSFGALPHMAVLATAERRPDAAIFLSPLNTGSDFRVSGPVVRWLSGHTSWLRRVVLFSMAKPAHGRASVWDIVDERLNLAAAARGDANPEDSSLLGYQCGKAAAFMESTLIPMVKGYRIELVYGSDDLYFSAAGFKRFAELLRSSANTAELKRLENSGHMVLLDGKAETVKSIIGGLLFPESPT